jgi:hypothetical protein
MAVATLATLSEVFGDSQAAGFTWSDMVNRWRLWRVASWIAAILAAVTRPLDDLTAQIGGNVEFSHDQGIECRVDSLLHPA